MARHKQSHYAYGNGRGRSGWGGGGGSNASGPRNSQADSILHQSMRCTHCGVSRPGVRFPKSVRTKYAKRVARGDDPASIKLICFDCCPNPNDANTNAGASAAQPPPPPPPPQPDQVRRGRCVECRVEYPLIRKFFTKVDIRIDAENRRVCYACRNRTEMDDAIDDAVAQGMEVVAEDDPNQQVDVNTDPDQIKPYGSDDEDDYAAPATTWEELPADQQADVLRAGNDFGNLSTKVVLALTLAQRRRRLRFVPSRELLRRHQEQLAERQIAALAAAASSRDDIAKRNASFGRALEFAFDLVPDHQDARELLDLVGQIDPAIIDYEYDADDPQDVGPNDDMDEAEDDQDEGPAVWHLTERERLDRIRRRRQSRHNPFAAPEQEFRPRDVQRLVQDDELVEHFQRCLAISTASPSPSPLPRPAVPTTFRMTYLLNALQARSRAMAPTARASSTTAAVRASMQPPHAKRVRFQS